MTIVQILAWIVYIALQLSFYVLWARIILDFVRQVRPDWRPKGFVLVLSVWLLRLTDPVLGFVRRFVKPVRVGGAAIDIAMLVLLLGLLVLMSLVGMLR